MSGGLSVLLSPSMIRICRMNTGTYVKLKTFIMPNVSDPTLYVGEFDAIIPGITGWAKIYGYNTILVDPDDDPYAGGFQVI